VKILDVGGTTTFWKNRGWADHPDFQIYTLNLKSEEQRYENIIPLTGDATDLSQFADRSFDVAFSNSVIEHLFTLENQERMASEMQRVGRAFYLQTPNFWFPMEPHFLVPGWQWMPMGLRVFIIRRWKCGWLGPCAEKANAQRAIEEIRLLKKRELETLFRSGTVIPELFCRLVKSWVVIGGF
jgi:hypothetical protein